MSTIEEVHLGSRSYSIEIGRGGLSHIGESLRERVQGRSCLLVSDDHVAPLYAETVRQSLDRVGIQSALFAVPAGETSKSQTQLFAGYDAALAAGLDRKAFVLALGGGVVGDLAGFLAASYLRGLDFIQVPTSLLAMVDSSVGGKTGINLPQGKNLIGAFLQPRHVLIDLDVLRTLEIREMCSGMAEVIKYGVIRDGEFFQKLEDLGASLLNVESPSLEPVVARCCAIKADVVGQDERESGLRAILNFGHTIGHAIENAAAYGTYLHGEAISMGMIVAARLSELYTGWSSAQTARLEALLRVHGLPVRCPALDWDRIVQAMEHDKKTISGTPRFVLAETLGQVCFGCEVDAQHLQQVWQSCAAAEDV